MPFTKPPFLDVFVWDLCITGYNQSSVDFENNAAKWIYNGFVSGPKFLLCDKTISNPSFAGGPGVVTSPSGYMERTYVGLASHDIVYYSVTLSLIGAWQSSDSFTIQIDNNPLKTYNPSPYLSRFDHMNCGSSSIASSVPFMVGKRFHSASSITIRISYNISSSVSFAVKDVVMSFATHQASDVNKESYQFMLQSSDSVSTGCGVSSYKNGSGNCQSCNSVCFLCFGPYATDCYIPHPNAYFNGTYFLSAVTHCIFGDPTGATKCLACGEGYVLDTDSTCKSSCTVPYVALHEGSAAKCMIPCGPGTYRQLDNTCSSLCSSHFVQVVNKQEIACTTPCGESINQFLNYNGSCISSCLYYMQIIDGNRICHRAQIPPFICMTMGHAWLLAKQTLLHQI